jgi:hypothetical protein
VKSFNYFAARLPRRLFLEPFLMKCATEPIAFIRSQRKLITHLHGKELSQHASSDDFILSTLGRPQADENQPPVEVPLCEAEPDMYPCLLAMCGSSNIFYRVGLIYSNATIDRASCHAFVRKNIKHSDVKLGRKNGIVDYFCYPIILHLNL